MKTDHILFIASGAFPPIKPSDLIPERGAINKVELDALSAGDFQRILTKPDVSLTDHQAFTGTEDLEISFSSDGIEKRRSLGKLTSNRK